VRSLAPHLAKLKNATTAFFNGLLEGWPHGCAARRHGRSTAHILSVSGGRQSRLAPLVVRKQKISAEIIDVSALGFGITVDGVLNWSVGQVVVLQAEAGSTEAEIMNISVDHSSPTGVRTHVGLRRLREIRTERFTSSTLTKPTTTSSLDTVGPEWSVVTLPGRQTARGSHSRGDRSYHHASRFERYRPSAASRSIASQLAAAPRCAGLWIRQAGRLNSTPLPRHEWSARLRLQPPTVQVIRPWEPRTDSVFPQYHIGRYLTKAGR
jgi:hypothetical protein